MQANENFLSALEKNNIEVGNTANSIEGLSEILECGIYKEAKSECYLLKYTDVSSIEDIVAHMEDKTGVECYYNDICINDYIENEDQALFKGVCFLNALKEILENEFDEVFIIIISFENGDCTVRFHLDRTSESWLSGNLEDYEDAVAFVKSEPKK